MANTSTSNPNLSNSIVFLKREAKSKGGLEKYFHFLKRAFENRGYPVYVLSEETFSLPYLTSAWKVYAFDRKCSQWIEKHKPKIIFGLDRNRMQTHIRAGNGCHAAYLQHRKKLEGNLTFYRCQINPLHRLLLHIEKEGYENPGLQTLFTNSKMVKNEILHFYDVDPKKIEVVHNGVEWKNYETAFEKVSILKEDLFHKYNLDKDDFQFLFVGSGFRRKGLDFLFNALSMFPHRNYHLSIVGKDKHIRDYQKQAAKRNIRATFFGSQQSLNDFYALADVTIIPSVYDPFANVTLESLSMGVPVITSKTNGGSEIITENRGWIIEDLYDSDSFLECLIKAVQKKKTDENSLAIRKSVQSFDFSHQLDPFIHKILNV